MAPTSRNGKICYLEIPAIDIAQSVAFYEAVFGWDIQQRGDGRLSFHDGVEVSGTWVTGRPPSSEGGVLVYIMVDSVATMIEAVVGHGGEIVQARMRPR
jgi:uncharacterized protein